MEDEEQERGSGADQRSEPVRSRWTPKPEQILILESIFNSGMVNPPKEETVRIRKLLEKFGPVGDANVFYWFQNRRSRSRRRQRQIQASLTAAGERPPPQPCVGGAAIQYENSHVSGGGFVPNNPMSNYPINTSSSGLVGPGSSSSVGLVGNDATSDHGYFSYSGHHPAGFQELHHNSSFGPLDATNLHYQSGLITVFINGVATEVGTGPLDMKAMFGGDYVLYHSSGVAVEVNENGFLEQSMQHGDSYFLVPRHS